MSSSGQNGLNLNTGPSDEDIDLLLPPKAELDVDGRRGSDTIEVVPPVDLEVSASGGRGNDTLLGDATGDVGEFTGGLLEGGKGRDRIVGSPLFDYIFPGPGADVVEAEGGSDAISVQLDKTPRQNRLRTWQRRGREQSPGTRRRPLRPSPQMRVRPAS